ncbi:MAG: DUF2635 domain-containing protein [Pseudomonadota bacterium]
MEIHVKPAIVGGKPLVVRDPADNQPLPAEGKTVTRDSYWIRRITDGDVIEIAAAKKKAKE